MKNKMSTMLCIGVVCILLSGCGAENSSQGERDTEQSVQNQTVVENQSQDAKIEAGKYADGYPRGELIAEQTFDLNLEPIGQVTFASYLPDDSENPLADVVFLIEKDGEIVSQDATAALAEITIKTAKEFIGYKRPKQEMTTVDEDVAKSLYEAFLKNEISVWMESPYDENGVELSVTSDEDYEFTNAKKEYTFLDVNSDGGEELIFRMTEDYSNIMYILGVSNEELVAFDVKETHSRSMAHGVYDNGIVWWGQNYDGEEEVYYTYTNNGTPKELIHFVKENGMTDEENTYDYYYFDGNVEEKIYLQSYDEYESIVSTYKGEWLEWHNLNE